MIHYHGVDGIQIAHVAKIMHNRHAFVSFAAPRRVGEAASICKTFALDNGAFSLWKSGIKTDWKKYYAWIDRWHKHPGFDFALIPDKIDGSLEENSRLLEEWPFSNSIGVPVWHLQEPLDWLATLCANYPRVAIGSSGVYAKIGTIAWWDRMNKAMNTICDNKGRPTCKIHGLRMLNHRIFTKFPFSSADSCNVAMTYSRDRHWNGQYKDASRVSRGVILADTIEQFTSAAVWQKIPEQKTLFTWAKQID